MALTLLEICSISKKRVLIRMAEGPIVRRTIRDKVAGDNMPVVQILAASATDPMVLTLAPGHQITQNAYFRIANVEGCFEINGIARASTVSGDDITPTVERFLPLQGNTTVTINGTRLPAYVPGSGIACLGETNAADSDLRTWTTGLNLDKVKQTDQLFPDASRANRSQIFNAANWAVAGKTITKLNKRAIPYDHSLCNRAGVMGHQIVFEFHIILEVDTAFTSGNSYNITFPASTGIAVQSYAFNDRTTRCHSIGVNQMGHKLDDESAVACLTIRLPQNTNYGQVDLVTEDSITNWEIIDASNNTVWSAGAAPVLRKNGTDTETGANNAVYSQDPDQYGLPITAISVNGSQMNVQCTGHGLSVNEIFQIHDAEGGVQGSSNHLNVWGGPLPTAIYTPAGGGPTVYAGYRVTAVADANNLTADRNISALSAYTGNGKLCKLVSLNSVGTYVHQMDFTAALASLTEGVYRIRIAGLGVSDPINIDSAVWARCAQYVARGIYHLNNGQACDGRFGFTRPAAARSPAKIYNVNVSADQLKEQEGGRVMQPVGYPLAKSTDMLEDYFGNTQNAGDWDSVLTSQAQQSLGVLTALAMVDKNNRYIECGWAKVKDTIGGIYTRNLFCDPLEMAIWEVDGLRRTQRPDGGVASGVQFGWVLSGTAWTRQPQASGYSNSGWYVCGPTHETNAMYSMTAAAIAWHLREFGHDDLADIWQASAIAAFDFCQTYDGDAAHFTEARQDYSEFPFTLSSNPAGGPPTWTVHSSSTQPIFPTMVAGTWTRSGTTCTCTISGNTFNNNARVYLKFRGSGPPDGLYTITNSSRGGPFTVTVPNSGATSGAVSLHISVEASGFTGGWAVLNGNTYTLRSSGSAITLYNEADTAAVDCSGFGAYTQNTGKFTPTAGGWANIWYTYARTNWREDAQVTAAILYALTGDTAYKTFHDTYNTTYFGWRAVAGVWYGMGASPTAGQITAWENEILAGADANLVYNGLTNRAFDLFTHIAGTERNVAFGTFGDDNFPYSNTSNILAHYIAYRRRIAAGDPPATARAHASVTKYLKHAQDALSTVLGVNAPKMCMGTGMGVRSPKISLSVDKEAMGVPIADGWFPYWLMDPTAPTSYFNSNAYNGSNSGGLYDWDNSVNPYCAVVPTRYAVPPMDMYLGNPLSVYHSEFDVNDHWYLLATFVYLHCVKGNSRQYDGKYRAIARSS